MSGNVFHENQHLYSLGSRRCRAFIGSFDIHLTLKFQSQKFSFSFFYVNFPPPSTTHKNVWFHSVIVVMFTHQIVCHHQAGIRINLLSILFTSHRIVVVIRMIFINKQNFSEKNKNKNFHWKVFSWRRLILNKLRDLFEKTFGSKNSWHSCYSLHIF